jgi:hypothetical protein
MPSNLGRSSAVVEGNLGKVGDVIGRNKMKDCKEGMEGKIK